MPGKLVSRMSQRECFTLNETDTIKTASQKLDEKKVGCMPVLDKNKNITKIGQMKKGRHINITDFDDITCFDGYKHKF